MRGNDFRERWKLFGWIGKVEGLIILGVLVVLFIYPSAYWASEQTILVTVQSKERVDTREGAGHYLVYCETEVLSCADSWLYLKFNSSDVYRDLGEKESYWVSVAGWRIPFLSWYRNIISIDAHVFRDDSFLADMQKKYESPKSVTGHPPEDVYQDIRELLRRSDAPAQ